jgi:hypothetical protein
MIQQPVAQRAPSGQSVRVSDGGGAQCWEWQAPPSNCSPRLENVWLDERFGFVVADEETLFGAHQWFVLRHPS